MEDNFRLEMVPSTAWMENRKNLEPIIVIGNDSFNDVCEGVGVGVGIRLY